MHYRLLAAFLVLSGAVHAETVSLVSGDDYKPFTDSKLPEGGMVTDLVMTALAEVKIEAKVDWKPWARGFDEARNGRYAGTFPYLRKFEREKEFFYSDVIVTQHDRAFIRAGNNTLDFNNVAGLTGTTICLPLGWSASPKLADMIASGQIKKSSPAGISNCINMLDHGRVDYFVTDETIGTAALKMSGVSAESVVVAGPPLADVSLYLIASKSLPGSKDFIAAFNRGLDAIRKNGMYSKIVETHSK